MISDLEKIIKEISILTIKLQKLRVQDQQIVDKIEALTKQDITQDPNKRYDTNGNIINLGDTVNVCSSGRKKSTLGIVTGLEKRFVVLRGNCIDPTTKKSEIVRREAKNLSILRKI